MFYFIILLLYTLQMMKVASAVQISLVQYGNKESDLLFDRDSSRAFCFPSEEDLRALSYCMMSSAVSDYESNVVGARLKNPEKSKTYIHIVPTLEAELIADPAIRAVLPMVPKSMMASMSDETSHHNWGYSSSFNYSMSLQRVGQVLCRQLLFSIYESIVPKAIEEKREKILWAAECLGYEQSITHCLYEEKIDPELNCTDFVGLKCANCDDVFYTINSNETLEVTSPGFPNVYNDNSMCRWTIRKNNPSSFVVNIKYLSLPPRSLASFCSKGSLDILSRKDEFSDYVLHETLCGNFENKLVIVNNSILDLRLHSGLFHPRPYGPAGFRIIISLLQDLQTEGIGIKPHSFSAPEIVGITFSVLFLVIPIAIMLRCLKTRIHRKRSQRVLARTLHCKVKPTTPCAQSSIKTTPLPAVPKKLCTKILINSIENHERKSSISSGIYEDILPSRKSASYLHLEEINKPEKSKSSVNYDGFKIPTFLITNYNDDDEKSCPSDMPSCSFTSDFDSVFGDDVSDIESFPQPKPKRNSTYTISKPKTFPGSNSKFSASINVFAANKNKRFSNPQSSSQRCFSDSDVKTETKIPDIYFSSLQKTYTQKFKVQN